MLRNYRYVIGVFALTMLSVDWGFAQGINNINSSGGSDNIESKFSIGGSIEQSVATKSNYDLDDDSEDGRLLLEPTLELDLEYEANKTTSAYLSLQYGRELEIEEEEEERSYKSTLELDEGYVKIKDIFDIDDMIKKSSLTVGRFSFSDNREWLYDKSLDGVLLSFELEPFDTEFSLSVNREEWIGSDLLRHDDVDTVNNFIAIAENKPFKDVDIEVAAYTIVRRDRSDKNDSPTFYGLSANGEFADKRISFWTYFAWVRGEEEDEKIKGSGLDIGATVSFDKKSGPYITLGYAFGSGDGDDDTDFRQTDLQGNSDKFGGVTNFKYYGELLDPELSNMHIYTAGIGYRFSSTASIDFVIHHYRQDVALDKLRSNDLDADPNGEDTDLGNELDIVIGVGLSENVETELVLGYFQPGPAFDEDDDDAFLFEATLKYSF